MVSTHEKRTNLVSRLCNTTALFPTSDITNKILIGKLDQFKKNAHFIIHYIYGKQLDGYKGTMTMSNMNILVSFLSNGGKVQQKDSHLLVDGNEIIVL